MAWLGILLGSYLMMLGWLWMRQSELLYLAARDPPSARDLASAGLRLWPPGSAATDYRGLLAEPPGRPARGTIVVFHGNAGTALDRTHYLPPLLGRGYRILLAEYPGYGGRPGAPSESRLVADGLATVAALRAQFGDPLLLWGESLGAGVAAAVAGNPASGSAGVVLLTPWDGLHAVAQHHYWYLPVRWLLRDRYDNIGNLSAYRAPIALLVAGQDDTIPPRHGLRLFATLQERGRRVRLWNFPAASHNDWPYEPLAPWWQEVLQFIEGGA
jgi:uncharacterized protein